MTSTRRLVLALTDRRSRGSAGTTRRCRGMARSCGSPTSRRTARSTALDVWRAATRIHLSARVVARRRAVFRQRPQRVVAVVPGRLSDGRVVARSARSACGCGVRPAAVGAWCADLGVRRIRRGSSCPMRRQAAGILPRSMSPDRHAERSLPSRTSSRTNGSRPTPTHAMSGGLVGRDARVRSCGSISRPAARETLRATSTAAVGPEYISVPESIEYGRAAISPRTRSTIHLATRTRRRLPGDRPPLIAISHGGPTTASSATLDLRVQFWTSRGFAVVDVNYGGSSGYGRAYRERLKGQWGIVDVEDMINAVGHLVRQGKADPERLIIRGGSAGGYTTLAALTFHAGRVQGRSELLRRQRHRGAGARHAQVRVAVSRHAGRAVSRDARGVSEAVSHSLRRPAVVRADLLPGTGGSCRAAEPVGDDGRRGSAEGAAGRVSDVRGRAARIPKGRDDLALPRGGALLLRGSVRLRARRSSLRRCTIDNLRGPSGLR